MTAAVDEQRTAPGARLAPAHLVGGVGAMVFAGVVIAQNVLRAAGLPANDADPAKVIDYYAGHRGTTLVLALLFPIGAVGLAAFVGALVARLGASGVWARALAGAVGGVGIFAAYSMMLATDLGLAAYVHRGHPEPSVVSALWVTHNAVFGVLLVSIAVALGGLSTGAAAAGIVAAPWRRVGPLGAVALGVAGAATPAIVDGSPVIGLGLLGFLTWVAFVVTAGWALLRGPDPTRP